MKATRYFQHRVLVERPEIKVEWCETATRAPEYTEIQEDGRVRHFKFIDEAGYYIRVITLPDGTWHNAFLDRDATAKRKRKR